MTGDSGIGGRGSEAPQPSCSPVEPLLRGVIEQAAGGPDQGKVTVTVAGRSLSAAQLLGAAAAVAESVRGLPMVAVHATTSLDTVVAVVGCLLAGVPAVPVPSDSGPAETGHILRDSAAVMWLGQSPPATVAGADVAVEHRRVDLDARAAAPTEVPDPSSPALVMYTSGTTGAPKGAVLSRAAVAAGLDGLAEAWDWTAADVLVHGLPLFHVHGLILGVLGPLRLGGRLVHPGHARPDGYAAAARDGSGTLFFGVPTIWSRIAASPQAAQALAGARLLVSGSAGLPAGVARDLAALTGQMPVERYGMTETMITIAARAGEPRRVGWVGRPIRGVEVRVVDDSGEPVLPDGEALGDLQVRGATLFDGYLGRPQETAESWTTDGWFRTGDVAALDADGWYKIAGRKAGDLIKSGGYRIGAGEIESSLLDHPAVAEAAVIGVPDDDLGQRIVAYVVRTADPADVPAAEASAAELIRHVAEDLSAHKRPREIRFVESLPRNEMGKVQKLRLTDQAD